MGLSLGMMGAGGSILAVPILVYFMGMNPIVATAYSLLIVGLTSLFGALAHWRRGYVLLSQSMAFALPAMFAVWLTRVWLLPSLPSSIMAVTKDTWIMLLFAGLMMLSALRMLRASSDVSQTNFGHSSFNLLFASLGVGLLTGMVGAGGGFLIVPSLVIMLQFNIKEAMGTSLVIIALNSLVGFSGSYHLGFEIDWYLIVVFLSMTFLGVFLGNYFNGVMNPHHLQRLFAWMTGLIGVGIFLQQLSAL